MKRLSIFVAVLAMAVLRSAPMVGQEQPAEMSVTVIQLEEACPPDAASYLETKMQQLLINNGCLCADGSRFVLTSKVNITEKDITSSGMYLQKMDVSFFMGDALTGQVFSMATVQATGVGESETKMMNKAFQSIKPSNPTLVKMIQNGKNNIVAHFQKNCDVIIRDAEMDAAQGNFDKAMTSLLTVPSFCEAEYVRCQEKALEIYELKKRAEKDAMNKENLQLLKKAQSTWAAKQDYESAEKALDILAGIDPDAECRADADALVQSISKKLRATEQAQWEFRKKQYEDRMEMSRQAQADKTALLGSLIGRFGKLDINIQKESTRRFGFASKQ